MPLTVIGPLTPLTRIAARRRGFSVTYSDPPSGGNAPGIPMPVAWWQARQVCMYSPLPRSIDALRSNELATSTGAPAGAGAAPGADADVPVVGVAAAGAADGAPPVS